MGKISDDLKQRLLATKTNLEFIRLVWVECAYSDDWKNDEEIKKHYEKIRYRTPSLADDVIYEIRKKSGNISYLRENNTY